MNGNALTGSEDGLRLFEETSETLGSFGQRLVDTRFFVQRSQHQPSGTVVTANKFKTRNNVAEWGFALGSDFWGTGIFMDAAQLVLDFAFDVLGAHRVEAKAAVKNGRGNGALHKLGAVQEAVLRRSFLRNGVYMDQAYWTILVSAWREIRAVRVARVVH